MPAPRWLARFNRSFTNRLLAWFVGRLPPFAEIRHVGRRSGRTYRTVIWAFPRHGGLAIALTYGSASDWVQNVLAAGEAEVRHAGGTRRMVNPRVVKGREAQGALPPYLRLPLRLLQADEALLLDRA